MAPSGVTGGKELAARLRRAGDNARREVAKAVEEGAEKVLADQKRMVPVRTGKLKGSLEIRKGAGGLTAHIGPETDGISADALSGDFFYARFLEYGTKGYRAGDRDIPPRPAQPFIRPAGEMNRNEINRLITDAVRRVVADGD